MQDANAVERKMLLGLKTLDGQEHWFGTPARTVPCFRCGLCCIGFLVKLSGKDINLLSRGLGISKPDLLRKYVRKTPVGPVLRQDGDDCVFLAHEDRTPAGCSVYAFRPEVCRSWVASLFRPECQEGLRRAGKDGKVLLPAEMYPSGDDAARLYALIEGRQA